MIGNDYKALKLDVQMEQKVSQCDREVFALPLFVVFLGRSERPLEEAIGLVHAVNLCLQQDSVNKRSHASALTVILLHRRDSVSTGGFSRLSLNAHSSILALVSRLSQR